MVLNRLNRVASPTIAKLVDVLTSEFHGGGDVAHRALERPKRSPQQKIWSSLSEGIIRFIHLRSLNNREVRELDVLDFSQDLP